MLGPFSSDEQNVVDINGQIQIFRLGFLFEVTGTLALPWRMRTGPHGR